MESHSASFNSIQPLAQETSVPFPLIWNELILFYLISRIANPQSTCDLRTLIITHTHFMCKSLLANNLLLTFFPNEKITPRSSLCKFFLTWVVVLIYLLDILLYRQKTEIYLWITVHSYMLRLWESDPYEVSISTLPNPSIIES